MNLRKLARGKECQIRIPGICCHQTETTVLSHVRQAGLTGGGQKAPDLLGAWACYRCHAAVDGELKTKFSQEELDLMHLQGVMRTQYQLIGTEVVRW